ncbi:hypothetical protein ACW5EG_16940 [Luteimonas sp. A611]
MKHSLVLVLATSLLAACTSYRLTDEPGDLIARDSSIPSLTSQGWEISRALSPSDASAKDNLSPSDLSSSFDQSWGEFLAKIAPGDELRSVRHNAGIGYAVFRGGVLVDMYLVTIF